MAIEFRCPNGHRLSCPDERAGRMGKCPKCAATFTVPSPDAPVGATADSAMAAAEASIPDPSGTSQREPGSSGIGSAPVVASAPAEGAEQQIDQIVFLCPNGHRLNCPSSLQGKPGKCPHCGAKFLIPQYEDVETEDGENYLDGFEPSEPQPPAEVSAEENQEIADYPGVGFNGGGYTFDFTELTTPHQAGPSGSHPMNRLFDRLWHQRGDSGVVELYLRSGQVVAPDWYAIRQSQETLGLFAVQDEDGSYVVTAVTWDSVERIALRGVADLPGGMFE